MIHEIIGGLLTIIFLVLILWGIISLWIKIWNFLSAPKIIIRSDGLITYPEKHRRWGTQTTNCEKCNEARGWGKDNKFFCKKHA